jgi:hypothetical protein
VRADRESTTVRHFPSAREAKEFLVSRIVEESRRENVPLSEIERKMLFFSETGWTLPDIMEVNDEFDREYDTGEYETKIAGLIRHARERDPVESPSGLELWSEAVATLEKEDHYILVMVSQAGISTRPPGDTLRLLGTACTIVTILLAGGWITMRYNIDWSRWVWPAIAAVVIVYGLSLVFVGRQRMHLYFGRAVGWVFGPRNLSNDRG